MTRTRLPCSCYCSPVGTRVSNLLGASGDAQNEAFFLKNESILRQSQASDQWAYYQSKSTKSHVANAAAKLATDGSVRRAFIAERDAEDEARLNVQHEANRLQAESQRLARKSGAKVRPNEHLAFALGFLQIGIALAPITVLTRRRWLLWSVAAVAATGIGAAITTFLD